MLTQYHHHHFQTTIVIILFLSVESVLWRVLSVVAMKYQCLVVFLVVIAVEVADAYCLSANQNAALQSRNIISSSRLYADERWAVMLGVLLSLVLLFYWVYMPLNARYTYFEYTVVGSHWIGGTRPTQDYITHLFIPLSLLSQFP